MCVRVCVFECVCKLTCIIDMYIIANGYRMRIRCYKISKNSDIVKSILEILYSVFARSHITLHVNAKNLNL